MQEFEIKCITPEMHESFSFEIDQPKTISLIKENQQTTDHIKDLERTLMINKEIISKLLSEKSHNEVNMKLNEENIILHNKVKELRNTQCKIQAKLLISEEIIKDLKEREGEANKKLKASQNSIKMKDQLIQLNEKRNSALQEALTKFAKKNENIWKNINDLNNEIERVKNFCNLRSSDSIKGKMLQMKQTDLESKTQLLFPKASDQIKDKNEFSVLDKIKKTDEYEINNIHEVISSASSDNEKKNVSRLSSELNRPLQVNNFENSGSERTRERPKLFN